MRLKVFVVALRSIEAIEPEMDAFLLRSADSHPPMPRCRSLCATAPTISGMWSGFRPT